MFVGGFAMAALAYGLEYFSAVIDYPFNGGGRPLDAWPAFMLVPFATGILAAAVAGFIALLTETGLPRLHDPLFAVEGFERASQDPFILALERRSSMTASTTYRLLHAAAHAGAGDRPMMRGLSVIACLSARPHLPAASSA